MAEEFKMRPATKEEREAIDKYIASISVDIGFSIWDLQEQVKVYDAYRNKGYKDGFDAGQTNLAHQIVEILNSPIDESNDYCTEICKKLNGIRQLKAIDELL